MEITDSARNRMFSNKDLVRLIIPLIIEQMLTVTVGLADSIMTANVGEEAVSGVSLVDSVMVLMINLFSALATGGAVVAGQFLGQRKNIMACKTADQLILFIVSLSVVIMAGIYACKNFILNVVFGNIEPGVMHNAEIYLMWNVSETRHVILLESLKKMQKFLRSERTHILIRWQKLRSVW